MLPIMVISITTLLIMGIFIHQVNNCWYNNDYHGDAGHQKPWVGDDFFDPGSKQGIQMAQNTIEITGHDDNC